MFCTQKKIANLVLASEKSHTFTVKSVIVKAPGNGFTAPVAEGLIFVGDSTDDFHKSKVCISYLLQV